MGFCAEILEGPRAGERVGAGEDQALPSASLIKVPVLVELLRRADSGLVSLEERVLVAKEDLVEGSEMLQAERLPAAAPLRRLAEGMIAASDNAAANVLISRLGTEGVNDLARGLGMHRTTLRRRMMDTGARARGEENLTSAADMVTLLGGIWRESSLSPGARTFALDLLLGQKLVSKVPVTVPSGARYAHKTGDLEGVENDAGLLLMPGRAVALAVLLHGDLGRALPAVASALSEVVWAVAGRGRMP